MITQAKDPKEKPHPNEPDKNIPTKPDQNPDPTKRREQNDPTRIKEPPTTDPTRTEPGPGR